MTPKRIQLQRTKGYRKPEGAVVVTRSSKLWGNPFRIGDQLYYPYSEILGGGPVRDRAHAVELFRAYTRVASGYDVLVRQLLAGKDLACVCPLDAPCHADVLLELANAPSA